MKVPENMESRKKDVIERQEEQFGILKDALKKYEAEKGVSASE